MKKIILTSLILVIISGNVLAKEWENEGKPLDFEYYEVVENKLCTRMIDWEIKQVSCWALIYYRFKYEDAVTKDIRTLDKILFPLQYFYTSDFERAYTIIARDFVTMALHFPDDGEYDYEIDEFSFSTKDYDLMEITGDESYFGKYAPVGYLKIYANPKLNSVADFTVFAINLGFDATWCKVGITPDQIATELTKIEDKDPENP